MSERSRQLLSELGIVGDPVHASLTARVDRLHDGRDPNRLEPPGRFHRVGQHGEPWLSDSVFLEARTHRRLVSHHVGGLDPDPGQTELLGNRRGRRDGPVRGDRHDRIDPMGASDGDNTVDVGEVDRFADVGDCKPDRLRIAVDGDHAPTDCPRLLDRREL